MDTKDGDHLDANSFKSARNYLAVPYMPSVINVQLTSRLPRAGGGDSVRTPDRPHLVVGAFGSRDLVTGTGRLRAALVRQCQQHADADCAMHSVNDIRNSTAHVEQEIIALYNQSVFCLGPSGDSYARKANIDALAVGCIPVVFYHASLRYPWHIAWRSSIRILIPAADVLADKVDVVDVLSKVPVDRVRAMQREIANLRISWPASVDVIVELMCAEAATHDCRSTRSGSRGS